MSSYEALYLHIPFCKSRCAYCDFTTKALAQDNPALDKYLARLIDEIRQAAKRDDLDQIKTIYVGGGTPTHLGHKRLVELGYLISLTIKLEQVEEYTLEANPESLSVALVNDLFALGVNRISIGAQSFIDKELALLGRAHDAAAITRAFESVRARFTNISLDLMCGIPEQTTATWQYSLNQALLLKPEHLSIYPLQLENGTPLARAHEEELIELPDEDAQADFLEQAALTLRAAGYHRYEVASYAKPGFESKHNTAYWQGAPYLGLGTGAASMINLPNGTRQRSKDGEPPEQLSAKEALAEDLFLAMRMAKGISEEELIKASSLLPHTPEVFKELLHLCLVEKREGRYLPTEKGWLLGNELYSRIWVLGN